MGLNAFASAVALENHPSALYVSNYDHERRVLSVSEFVRKMELVEKGV